MLKIWWMTSNLGRMPTLRLLKKQLNTVTWRVENLLLKKMVIINLMKIDATQKHTTCTTQPLDQTFKTLQLASFMVQLSWLDSFGKITHVYSLSMKRAVYKIKLMLLSLLILRIKMPVTFLSPIKSKSLSNMKLFPKIISALTSNS
jgi:hypothetical protein